MTNTTAADLSSDMQMIRAEIYVRRFQRWMGSRRLDDLDHAMHCLLVECYGELAPKPFRAILPRGSATGVLYGYGVADAAALREHSAMFADPIQAGILPAETLDSKVMPGHWQVGKRLGFEIRIRPVVRINRKGSNSPGTKETRADSGILRPGSESDAYLYEALQHPDQGTMDRSREEVYSEWLAKQLDRRGGASLEAQPAKLVSFQRTRAVRKLRGRGSEGPDAVLRGTITVTDSAAFELLLRNGVGRHRSYGYGMLLLRPAS